MVSEKQDGCIREENKTRGPVAFTRNCSPGQRSTGAVVHAGLLAMHIAESTSKGWAFPSADGHSSEAEILSQGEQWQLALRPVVPCRSVCSHETAHYGFQDHSLGTWKSSWKFHKAEDIFILLYNCIPDAASHDCHQPQSCFVVQSSRSQINIFSLPSLSLSQTVVFWQFIR